MVFKDRPQLSRSEMLLHGTAIVGFAESINEISDVTVITSEDLQGCIDNLLKTEENSVKRFFSL